MAISFPTTPTVGQVYTIGGINYTWSGSAWVSSRDIYLQSLKDVDVTTVAHTNGQALVYDLANTKWIPGSAGVSLLWQVATPSFTGLTPGQIWIKSDTLEQSIYVVDDASNNIWLSLGVSSTNTGTLSNRNKLMNGDFNINQRVQAAALNVAGNIPSADRWITNCTLAGKMTVGRNLNSITPPAGFSTYTGHQTIATPTTPSAADVYQLYQGIEGCNMTDLNFGSVNAKTITVSFWYRASIAGTYCFGLKNNPTTHMYVKTFDITSANTWQYVTAVIPGCTLGTWSTSTGSGSMYIMFDLGSGSQYNTTTPNTWIASTQALRTAGCVSMISTGNANVYITGVQLEVGSVVPTYEMRPFDEELRRCKRHFQKSYPYTTALATNTGDGRRYGAAAYTYFFDTNFFEVEMAFAPSLTSMSTVGSYGTYWDTGGSKVLTTQMIGTKHFVVYANNNATATSSYYYNWWVNAEI
jgi:hypothetical protein